MQQFLYFLLATILLAAAYIVFRKIVRNDYLEKGNLTWFSSLLQLLVFVALMCFPYLYNPPEWPWFWKIDMASDTGYIIIGFITIILGMTIAFGTMIWFGLRRAFGILASGIIQSGPYRISRNPQIIGGYLLVIGAGIQWPSLYSFGWVILYGLIGHMMIITEEEYLGKWYGEEYIEYCDNVPRYLSIRIIRRKASA